MTKIFTFPQYSPEWWEARRGKATASNMHRILTPKTGKLSASHVDYICELIADLANPGSIAPEGFVSPAMIAGSAMEPHARRFYEFDRNIDVQEVGGCLSDCGRHWCSPDGLVGEEGGIEIKYPEAKTHVRYMLDGTLPDDYKVQVHSCLLITGRKWWDWISYSERFRPIIIRVVPDKFTDALAVALEEFDKRYREALAKIGPLEGSAAA